MDRRTRNIEIFEDTMKLCKENRRLSESVKKSVRGQQVILESENFERVDAPRYTKKAEIVVSMKRTFEAAMGYKGQKTAVHNFASATNPGGGVTRGSSAQEECLCRCSTLYPAISSPGSVQMFHYRHRQLLKEGKLTALYNDDCIYTPGVTVFKSDTDAPGRLPEFEWYDVDVITAAAPNLREKPSNRMNPGGGERVHIGSGDLKKLHVKRMSRVMELAKRNQVEVLVLGAFGCGAFQNPPEIVAEAMDEAVERYRYEFAAIEFAIYCSPRDRRNYEVFQERF